MERIFEISPAWDKRHTDPSKNYGVHGVEMRFLVKDEKGAIQFLLSTGWHLPHVVQEHKSKGFSLSEPMPFDLGYHSPEPMYEGQEQMSEKCRHLDDKPCYYDGSSLYADKFFDIMVEKGHEALWKALEKEHKQRFNSR